MTAPAPLQPARRLSRAQAPRFEDLLQAMRPQARHTFRQLPASHREELIAETIAQAFCAFHRLVERGRGQLAYATPLAQFAIRHVRAGRRAGAPLNKRDACSPYAQRYFMRSDYVFQVCRCDRFSPSEDPDYLINEVAGRCRQFGVRWIGADGGGNGHVLNRLLLDRLNRPHTMYAFLYSASSQEPRQDGILSKWTVDRSATIGALFSRVKKRKLIFPRATEVGSYLDEFSCEVAEYDDLNRTVRYTHPDNQQDDAMHATNYAVLVAIRLFRGQQGLIDF